MPVQVRNLNVKVNGAVMELPPGTTLSDLLCRLEIAPVMVAVELNREIVPKSLYEQREIRDGDSVEIVHFVGGG